MANEGISGPSSAIGLTRFFDVDSGGPKVKPEIVVGIAIAFIVLIISIRLFSGLPI